jgi:aspartate-semialdehyde dehydrogenase
MSKQFGLPAAPSAARGPHSAQFVVAVVGATGAVGQEMLKTLAERRFPVGRLVPLASARSAGRRVRFADAEHEVRELGAGSFAGVELALFSAGGATSLRFAPEAARAGAIVVDNTSAFRMEPDIPLVVPEVNPDEVARLGRRIIANPNCSTIQMLVALEPIRRAAGIKRIVVSTYQATAGAGARAMAELGRQARLWAVGEPIPPPEIFPHQILFECLPQIGAFCESGDTVEEEKMINETRKIFGDPAMRVSATTVRVPVLVGHSESVNVELERALSARDARRLLEAAPGVAVVDDPASKSYPLARRAAGTDPVYVGRIREDRSVEHGLNLWVVADNLRKGAALNAVQIGELLIERGLL